MRNMIEKPMENNLLSAVAKHSNSSRIDAQTIRNTSQKSAERHLRNALPSGAKGVHGTSVVQREAVAGVCCAMLISWLNMAFMKICCIDLQCKIAW